MASFNDELLSYIDSSPSPFHTVASTKKLLEKAGFKEIKEKDSWSKSCVPGDKYYLTRNSSTIVAFAIGKKWTSGNAFSIVGAHTDSPCLRIKPVSIKEESGYLQVGIETYGYAMWHTWFDRDLGVAGRVMVRSKDGSIGQKLVHIDHPIFRIPTLAIHLDPHAKSFSFNTETQLLPIAGLVDDPSTEELGADKQEGESEPLKLATERHHPSFIKLLAEELAVRPEEIVDFELLLYDVQKACLGGLRKEFIFASRLDNLVMSYTAIQGLIRSVDGKDALEEESSIRMVALFDDEEVGSRTAQGADSNVLLAILRRLSVISSGDLEDLFTAFDRSMSRSFLLSADMAHAIHPNYGEKHESKHAPRINKGVVVKLNANARYATNSPGVALLQEVARADINNDSNSESAVPLQLFVVRNDSNCGSTIGPLLSALLGIRTVDLGNPQLSMHSVRETCGSKDVEYALLLFLRFFQKFSKVAAGILEE
jgi:aspartyl aminopeptidase